MSLGAHEETSYDESLFYAQVVLYCVSEEAVNYCSIQNLQTTPCVQSKGVLPSPPHREYMNSYSEAERGITTAHCLNF